MGNFQSNIGDRLGFAICLDVVLGADLLLLDDVRVLEFRQGLHFGEHKLLHCLVEVGVHNFNGNFLARLLIEPELDLATAAFSECSQYLELTNLSWHFF